MLSRTHVNSKGDTVSGVAFIILSRFSFLHQKSLFVFDRCRFSFCRIYAFLAEARIFALKK